MTFEELLLVAVDVRTSRPAADSPVLVWVALPQWLWRSAGTREVFAWGPTAAAAHERAGAEVARLVARSGKNAPRPA